MKLNLKAIALAAALVAAGSAHADLVGNADNTATGSSLALVAFNSVTNAYYVRDLGVTLNSFLPSSVTTLPGDGGGAAISGTRTPEAGASFSSADTSFTSWLAGQTASAVRWTVIAGDSASTGVNGVARLLLAINGTAPTNPVTNGTVRNASTALAGLKGQNPGMGLSATGDTVLPGFSLGNYILQPATLSLLDVASNLFYFSATTQTLSSSTVANSTRFGNSGGFASVVLSSSGDFTYSLAPAAVSAVPVPAAAWLLGSGLLGIGGMMRRRKAAAQA